MENCARCDHVLDGGRYCTNCGHPVGAPLPGEDDWRTGTAERPAVRDPGGRAENRPATPPLTPPPGPPAPPPVPPVPPRPVLPPPPAGAHPSPRYPLFADQVASPVEHPRGAHRTRDPRRWVAWAVGFAVLALVAALGTWLLVGGTDSDPDDDAVDSPASATPTPSTSPEPSPSASPTPSPSPSAEPSGEPEDVARLATARVPATAPPNEDVSGNLVRYEARNMLDGVAETCWRMAGDGSGEEITFELAGPTRLTEVGLVNGYAKTATDARGRRLDWYHGNRRVLAVEWSFDDGTSVTQSLDDTRRLQTVSIDPTETATVRLRLISASAPGTGRSARNYTAISDVSLVGTPR